MSAPSPSPPPGQHGAAEAAHDSTILMRAPSAPYLAPQGLEGLEPDPHASEREAALEQQVQLLLEENQELRRRLEVFEPQPKPQGEDRGPDR